VVSHLEATWADPGGFRTWFEIAGDGGLLTHDSRQASALTKAVRSEGGSAPDTVFFSPLTPDEDPYYQQISAFAAAIRGESPVAVPPEDARRAITVAAAARESVRTGAAVTIFD
jgi:predicted dehydrogenase